jgi:hypothetical protein
MLLDQALLDETGLDQMALDKMALDETALDKMALDETALDEPPLYRLNAFHVLFKYIKNILHFRLKISFLRCQWFVKLCLKMNFTTFPRLLHLFSKKNCPPKIMF